MKSSQDNNDEKPVKLCENIFLKRIGPTIKESIRICTNQFGFRQKTLNYR